MFSLWRHPLRTGFKFVFSDTILTSLFASCIDVKSSQYGFDSASNISCPWLCYSDSPGQSPAWNIMVSHNIIQQRCAHRGSSKNQDAWGSFTCRIISHRTVTWLPWHQPFQQRFLSAAHEQPTLCIQLLTNKRHTSERTINDSVWALIKKKISMSSFAWLLSQSSLTCLPSYRYVDHIKSRMVSLNVLHIRCHEIVAPSQRLLWHVVGVWFNPG